MVTVAFMNLKGGVAKTTTTVNTAAILARDYGKRVLVIDADSQANTTEFLTDAVPEGTLATLLKLETRTESQLWSAVDDLLMSTRLDNVDLLPAADSLMDLDLTKVGTGEVYITCLQDMLRGARVKDRDIWDYVLIDCPPAFNAAAVAALLAADKVVIPMKLDAFSLRGMANIMRQIQNMKKVNPGLQVGGILPTMWYGGEEIRKAERMLRLHDMPVYHHIRRSDRVDDMTFRQQALIYSSPKSGACRDYKIFVRELAEGG